MKVQTYAIIHYISRIEKMLYTLLGPLEGHIHNLRLVNGSDLFEGYPEPNWVATATVELKAIKDKP